jgi:pyruvate/2-oxoacid:ferredoxin oxidoreductase beta subunit
MSDQSSNPESLGSSSLPSSFDDTEFFDESRTGKLWRKLRQEPLIPLGCAATCYALYQASKSIREGNPYQTNKMFRARIYAQGFTLVAIVAGSIFYKDERMRRKAFEKKEDEKKQTEKREKWLRELEVRDKEDREWRARIERESEELREVPVQGRAVIESQFPSKSVKEEITRDGWGPGRWVLRTRDAWRRL